MTGRSEGNAPAAAARSLVVAEGHVHRALESGLRFAGALYDLVDPYERFARLKFSGALQDLG
jgi:hypothetical protein